MKLHLSSNTSYQKKENELIILDKDKDMYYGLTGATCNLWLLLKANPLSIEEIYQIWEEKYSNSTEEIKDMLHKSIELLKEKDLIRIDD